MSKSKPSRKAPKAPVPLKEGAVKTYKMPKRTGKNCF